MTDRVLESRVIYDLGFFLVLALVPALFLVCRSAASPSTFMVKTSDYDAPQTVPSGKRKKVDEDAISGMAAKKQRTRVR